MPPREATDNPPSSTKTDPFAAIHRKIQQLEDENAAQACQIKELRSKLEEKDDQIKRLVEDKVSISSKFYAWLFVQKCFAHLLSSYSLALKFFFKIISALVKCWWNWLQFACLEKCKSDTNCNWFTFFPESNICELLHNCSNLDVQRCPDCLTGQSNCVPEEPTCFVKGECRGKKLHIATTATQEDCLQVSILSTFLRTNFSYGRRFGSFF